MSTVTNGLDLVRVTSENADVLGSVAEDVFDSELSSDLINAFVSARSSLLVVALLDGAVVGQVQGDVQLHLDGSPQLYIDNLGVAERVRREGIGTGLPYVSGWCETPAAADHPL